MRALNVNFVWRRPIWSWLAIAASTAFAVAAMHQAWSAMAIVNDVRTVESEVVRLTLALDEKRKQASVGAPAQAAAEPAYFKDALELSELAAFDAGMVLRVLEAVQVVGVKVTSLDMVPKDGGSRVELEVADSTALLQYLEQLNAGTEPPHIWQLLRTQSPTPTNAGTASILGRAGVGAR